MCIPREPILRLNFRKSQISMGIISGEQAGKLLRNGAVWYIVYLVNQPKDKARVEQVPKVKEFLDVFPQKLDTLPPNREVEFVVDLLLGVNPISKTSSQIAPVELQELKVQL